MQISKKGIIGIVLASLSMGGLVYLYLGLIKPRQEAYDESVEATKK
jgi:hypothetical protein